MRCQLSSLLLYVSHSRGTTVASIQSSVQCKNHFFFIDYMSKFNFKTYSHKFKLCILYFLANFLHCLWLGGRFGAFYIIYAIGCSSLSSSIWFCCKSQSQKESLPKSMHYVHLYTRGLFVCSDFHYTFHVLEVTHTQTRKKKRVVNFFFLRFCTIMDEHQRQYSK